MADKRKPCAKAIYGSRGEWYCNVHKTADPDSGCPPESRTPAGEKEEKGG